MHIIMQNKTIFKQRRTDRVPFKYAKTALIHSITVIVKSRPFLLKCAAVNILHKTSLTFNRKLLS
jgi:hypothetical protein